MFWKGKKMRSFQFDDSNVTWHSLEGIEHLEYFIYDVDEDARIVDILFKLGANQKVVTHKHLAPYKTLILQGELRIYEPDGTLDEVRPVGSYVSTEVSGKPHTEGGGNDDVIAFFSIRNIGETAFELLDDEFNTVAKLGLQEFNDLWQAQTKAAYELGN